MSDTVISVENISKSYRLGVIGTGTFYGDLKRWWAKQLGKPDPYLRINETDHGNRIGEIVWALRDINIQVNRGEVLGIIGRNGAGKSTLLKILSQVTTPTTGQINVKGRIASLLEVGTGFHPELTGRENIYLNGAIMGMNRSEVNRKLDEIIDFSGVEKYIDTPVKRYSSGMYVRLAFAVAAHLEPEILIVDEVLAVGDFQFQQKCLGKMGDVASEGRTVLFVSHNLSAIRRLCPRCILLERGSKIADGLADTVIDQYMEGAFKSEGQYEQPSNKSKPINLRKVSVLNKNGKKAFEIDYKEGFSIQIEYEVNNNVINTIAWIDIRTHDEIHVLGTSDYDMEPVVLQGRVPGYYKSIVHFPPKFINKGSYYVVVGLTQEVPNIISYDRVDACNFIIMDNDSYPLKELNERGGVVKPKLPWETKKLR